MADVRRFIGGAVVLEVCGWNNPIVRKNTAGFLRALPNVTEYCIVYEAEDSVAILWLPDMKGQKNLFEVAHDRNHLMGNMFWRMARSVRNDGTNTFAATSYVPGSVVTFSDFCIREIKSLVTGDTVETAVYFCGPVVQREPGYIKTILAYADMQLSPAPVVPDLSTLW